MKKEKKTTASSVQELKRLRRRVAQLELVESKRKRAEEALRESEAHYHGIFDSASDAFLIFDLDGNIVEANPQACKMYGYSYDELIKLSGKNIVHPDYYHLFEQFKRDVQTTGEFHAESVDVHKDGTPFNIEVRGTTFDYLGKPHLLADIRDITERKQTETTQQVLHQIANAVHTTKDLNELFNTIRQDLSIILNTENFFIALYDRKSDTFTLPYIEDEKDTFDTFPAGKTLTAYVVKHDKPLLVTDEDMHRLTQSGVVETIGASSKIWLGVPLKAGKEIIGALVVQSYTDENVYDEKDLEILKFASSQIGLSIERKRAHEALREERDKTQRYLDVAGTIFVAIDADQKVSLVNKKGCEILGYKEEKIIGKNWFDNFLPEAVRDKVKSVFTKLMAGNIAPAEYSENPVLTKSGEKRIITWHNAILKDE
ncbi:PAS domain S-box protein, partial [bacterium]|nr:PAS domain S-box protein [bacterium]